MAKVKTFEENLSELEGIVTALESGEIDLEESMKLFENGIKLSKSCQNMLNKAEQKVTILLQNEAGTEVEETFDKFEEQ